MLAEGENGRDLHSEVCWKKRYGWRVHGGRARVSKNVLSGIWRRRGRRDAARAEGRTSRRWGLKQRERLEKKTESDNFHFQEMTQKASGWLS